MLAPDGGEKSCCSFSHQFVHAFPSTENPPSNGICRKLGFTLLEVCRFEYPPNSGNWMLCNDWQLDLTTIAAR